MGESPANNEKPKDKHLTHFMSSRSLAMWHMVLLMYLLLLAVIGYIAFWDQDFNKPERMVANYVQILSQIKEENPDNQIVNSAELVLIVEEVMKKNVDSAGDLQELASQSFNVILGAILAFLSASATMIFQNFSSSKGKDDKE